MNKEALEKIATDLIYQGKEYEDVRRELLKRSSDSKLIDDLLFELENDFVYYQLNAQKKSDYMNRMILGAVLFLLGTGITLMTYFSNSSSYMLFFGAILGGAWIFKEAYKSYHEPLEPDSTLKNRFKRNKFQR